MAVPDSRWRVLEAEDYLVLSAVLLLPWAFGGVDVGSFRVASLLLVAGAAVAVWKRGLAGGLGLDRRSRWLLPAFLLGGWAALQLVPLPPAAVRLISPEAFELYSEALPGYPDGPLPVDLQAVETRSLARVPEAAGKALPDDPGDSPDIAMPACLSRRWQPLSLQPSATLERLAWYAALLLGFLVMRDRARQRERFKAYRLALFVFFAALAVFAFVQSFTWNGKILWIRRVLIVARPFGPYFNPNNLAGVMELAVPALAGYAWARWQRVGRAAVYEPGFGGAAVAAGVCLIAGLAAASKLAALLIAGSVVLLAALSVRSNRARWTLVGGIVAVVLVAVFLILPATRLGERVESFVERAEGEYLFEGRLIAWRASGQMLKDFPLTGSGFGTFRGLFVRYVPAGSFARWSHAHNDYLELLLTGGIVAFGLLLWLIWGYVVRAVRGLRRSGRLSPARLGLVLGVLSLSVHALFDFNHQIPANALLFVAVCALTLGSETGRDA